MKLSGNKFTFDNHLTNIVGDDYPFYLSQPLKLHDGVIVLGYCNGIDLSHNPKQNYFGIMVFDSRFKNAECEYWFHGTKQQVISFFGELK